MPLRQVTHWLMLTAVKVRQERVIISKLELSTRRPAPYAWAGPTFQERFVNLWNTEHEE
ncbi:hypothetical protein [Deinococcus sp. AJ005]|uniref:hypothetical protein n=1 Tax=Deinococcus sp. AJ005 TaxID=2652443 RepID=UPI0018656F04|nr:hypothetical protein [Deinococcus sp. AJ005]